MDISIKERFQVQWFKYIEENPDKPWFWDRLSMNPSISWKFVQENPDKPWDWYGLSWNPSITWKIVQENPDRPWDWCGLSQNKMSYPYTLKIKKTKEVLYWKLFREVMNRRKMNMYSRYLLVHHLLYKN